MKLPRLKPFALLVIFHLAVVVLALVLLARQKGRPAAAMERIVVLSINGVITSERGAMGRGVSADSLVEDINSLREDDEVKALVLRIDSPGGSVGTVQEIFSALNKFKAKGKVIVASFGDVSASGGYYLACAADQIITHPGTITGSIGVIMELPNVEGLLGKVGVSMTTIKSGAMKDSGSPFRKMSETERTAFNDLIQDAYGQFYIAVKAGRKMDDARLKPLADGRIFSGRDAVEKKLADGLGDLEDAIEVAKKLTGLTDKNPQIEYTSEQRPLDRILDLLSISPMRDIASLATDQKVKLMYVLQ